MNMWAKDEREDGKLYEKSGRFRLVIEIFSSLDDPVGKILRRMKSGTVIIYSDFDKAKQAQDNFMDEALHATQAGTLAVYGMTCIVDTFAPGCHNARAIHS
jgi:hypothetical protein